MGIGPKLSRLCQRQGRTRGISQSKDARSGCGEEERVGRWMCRWIVELGRVGTELQLQLQLGFRRRRAPPTIAIRGAERQATGGEDHSRVPRSPRRPPPLCGNRGAEESAREERTRAGALFEEEVEAEAAGFGILGNGSDRFRSGRGSGSSSGFFSFFFLLLLLLLFFFFFFFFFFPFLVELSPAQEWRRGGRGGGDGKGKGRGAR